MCSLMFLCRSKYKCTPNTEILLSESYIYMYDISSIYTELNTVIYIFNHIPLILTMEIICQQRYVVGHLFYTGEAKALKAVIFFQMDVVRAVFCFVWIKLYCRKTLAMS